MPNPVTRPPSPPERMINPDIHLSARRRKKAEYARLQRIYKKNRKSAYDKIFSGTCVTPNMAS